MQMPRLLKNLVWLLLLLFLTSCNDFTDIAQPATLSDCVATLSNTTAVGQTFVARHGGLDAFEIYLQPDTAAEGSLVLHLRASPIATTDILTSTVLLSPGAAAGYYRFPFTPILHSHSQYYYAFLQPLSGFAGAVQVPCGAAATYADGSLYEGDLPQDAQSSFKLHYAPTFIALDLALMGVGWLGYGAVALGILFFAGYTLVRGWVRKVKGDFTVTLIMSAMAALAAWMTFLVWGDLIHLRLSSWSVRAWMGIAVVIGLYCFYKDQDLWRRRVYWVGSQPMATLLLWLVVLIGISFRLFLGRGMVMLPGSDTYHHTLIAQLFAEQGGLPDSYEPYAPLSSFTYHFGFHSIVALFRWLLGTELLLTTKTTALVLNGAIAATTALLSERLAGDRKAGVVSAALIGLIMVSPFCLLRWGRFTQTTGMLFLPLAILPFVGRRDDWSPLWVPSSLIAALVFAHNREAFFAVMLLGVMALLKLIRHERRALRDWLWTGSIAVLMALPWLVRIVWVQLDPQQLRIGYEILGEYNDLSRLELPVLSFITNLPVLVLSMAALVALLWDRQDVDDGIFILWALVLALGGYLYFELTQSFQWDLKTSVLTLSVPIAIFLSIRFSHIMTQLKGTRRQIFLLLVALLLGIGCLAADVHFPAVLNGGPLYLRQSDVVAMRWIEEHTPSSALFLVNSLQPEWSPGWLIGSDAGYWLPLLTHREVTLPPMIYAWEAADRSVLQRNLASTYDILAAAEAQGALPATMACCTGITHFMVYDNSWPVASGNLLGSEAFEPIYRQDRLWVFQIACDESCP